VAVAAGASIGSLVADGIGLSIAGRHAPTAARVSGAALLVVAVLTSATGARRGGNAGDFALAALGGFAIAFQHPINSRVGKALGDPLFGVLASFTGGTLVTVALTLDGHRAVAAWPRNPLFYAGGFIGAAFVFAAIRIVARVGALRLSVSMLAGQLVGAALLDGFIPVAGRRLTTAALVGIVLAVAAVALSSRTPQISQENHNGR